MAGSMTKDEFVPDKNYDQFYGDHIFEPFPDELAMRADEVLPRVGWALDIAQEIGARKVLDLCCLDGFASLTLAAKLGMEAHGVDLSRDGIDIANKRAGENNLNASYSCQAIEHLGNGNNYDLVLLFEAIEHFLDVDRVMEVIKGNLRPNGTLLVSTPDAEGVFGIGNDDAAHLQIYSHRREDLPTNTHPATKNKPIISLPEYLSSQGFNVTETEVYNDLIHCRAVLK